MRGVSKRLPVLALLLILSAPAAFAATKDGNRPWIKRVAHFIVIALDQLGVPHP